MTRILEGEKFSLDSTGNGSFYLLRHKAARRSTFFQSEDATSFEERLEATENAFPEGTPDSVLSWLWDQCEYGSVSRADEKESDVD
jgi:hypothetical protein